MKAKLHYVFSLAIFLIAFSSIGQNSSWKKIDTPKHSDVLSKFKLNKDNIAFYKLDMSLFKSKTSLATLKSNANKHGGTVIYVPSKNGTLEAFRIYEDPIFSPSLSAKYPNIKSYIGLSENNTGTRLRMSVSPHGVQTMISSNNKPTIFMQPISKGSTDYVVYDNASKNTLLDRFECKTVEELSTLYNKSGSVKANEGGANDQTLQKFRIAISTTAEYTAYHYVSDSIADALAAINATLTRVNEVFENDMAVKFELVDVTQLIFTDPSTDPYSNANIGIEGSWNTELQNTLTSVIGETAYDIGHLFGASGGGGNAGCIGCVCVDGAKGSAYTSPSNAIPEGDTFDIDFVAHEIGHQMGANHTFAYDVEGTGVNSEPGSGSTIMAYAGITGSNDVQSNSDDYFHYHSIKQILENLSAKSCQTTEPISNNPPSANAGNDYHIPAGTAYVLKGSAVDLDNSDNLTFCWEQTDSGNTNYLNFGPELTSGSMNRSLPPTTSTDRYIPRFSSVLDGNLTQTNPTLGSDWETVSTVARTLNWALTVRDRDPLNATGGQTSFDTMVITVEDVLPFTVENPVSWAQGDNVTINWVVGETANSSINCQNVNIKLSTDGGVTFPITIAANTANDGSFDYTVPSITDTPNARILVEAADNIFYDVSDFDFTISQTPDFFIVQKGMDPIECGASSVTYTFDYVAANGFSDNTLFSASNLPTGASAVFSPTNLSNSGSFTLTLSNLTTEGDYTFTITGTSSTIKNISVDLPFYNGLCSSVANTEYKTSTTRVQFNTIDNISTKPSGYSNYKSISTDVNRGFSYDLTVYVNTDGDFTTTTKVWIDWNQDCVFSSSDEEYNLGDATNVISGATSNSALSITVPIGAVSGNTTMRVSTKFKDNGLPTACENGFDGEVEDYTINILEGDFVYDSSITMVEFNTINQTSGKPSNYSDYSSIGTEVNRDSSYNLNVRVNTEGDFTTSTKVWVDWNQNSSFDDAGEEYDLGNATNVSNEATSNSPLSINIPIDAILGNTTMRIVTGYTGNSGSLEPVLPENNFDGEAEDYTLTILPTQAVEEFGFDNLKIYPNPNNGVFTIQLNDALERNIAIDIFDFSGKHIYNKTFQNAGDFSQEIQLVNLQSGMYFLSINDGKRESTKKLIVN